MLFRSPPLSAHQSGQLLIVYRGVDAGCFGALRSMARTGSRRAGACKIRVRPDCAHLRDILVSEAQIRASTDTSGKPVKDKAPQRAQYLWRSLRPRSPL